MIQWSAGNSVNLNHLPIVVNVQTHARLGERGKQARHRPPLGRELQRLASRLGGDAPELQGVDAVFALAVLAVADLGHRPRLERCRGRGEALWRSACDASVGDDDDDESDHPQVVKVNCRVKFTT